MVYVGIKKKGCMGFLSAVPRVATGKQNKTKKKRTVILAGQYPARLMRGDGRKDGRRDEGRDGGMERRNLTR